jgi:hypothetical protein
LIFWLHFRSSWHETWSKKVLAIQDAIPPTSTAELRSFLGTVNYVSRFIYDFSTITAPLRAPTRHGTKWQWTKQHYHAFDELKRRLTTSPAMAYFDPAKDTELANLVCHFNQKTSDMHWGKYCGIC